MSIASDLYDAISHDLRESGLLARGGFSTRESDQAPDLRDGRAARTVIMVGNAGPSMWQAFSRKQPTDPDPLDRWSHAILERVAAQHDADVAMPSDGPPFAPFQRWAMRAEPVFPSPLGLLIHPTWGLWHGYRGALLFPMVIEVPRHEATESLCDHCENQPCLSACPVDAFQRNDYQVDACVAHLETPEGQICMTSGCRARHACPVGQSAFPGADQAGFHMRAFVSGRSS